MFDVRTYNYAFFYINICTDFVELTFREGLIYIWEEF